MYLTKDMEHACKFVRYSVVHTHVYSLMWIILKACDLCCLISTAVLVYAFVNVDGAF